MKDILKQIIAKKYFHICMILIIVVSLLFVLGIVILRYNVEGETNMPFNVSKISIISSTEGIDKDSGENKWAFDINQNNDIFIYVEKNSQYQKNEVIKTIDITNIKITKDIDKGNKVIYKPEQSSENSMFVNKEENKVDSIEYVGAMESNIQKMQISNQGGIIAFRYANDKIGEYVSNDDEVNHSNLLKSANITQEDLQAQLNFDIIIKVESGKEYQANISLDVPVKNIVEEGTSSIEKTDLNNIIFKRIKN